LKDAPDTPCCAPRAHRQGDAPPAPADVVGRGMEPTQHDFAEIGDMPFLMGSNDGEGFAGDGEGPQREVRCRAFRIAKHAVSNRQFSEFVSATAYRTVAERSGWSFVFHLDAGLSASGRPALSVEDIPWWVRVEGACWKHPEGPASDIDGRANHPVTHVSWFDAVAYCRWSGTRLPTEAEWECAARGGLRGKRFAWGDDLEPGGEHQCNIWQGRFPEYNSLDDGYAGTAPVNAYRPNGHGLFNVCGNVWEWCFDWFSPNYHRVTRRTDPIYLIPTGNRSMRGGSFLCHHSYCNRYRVAARSSNSPDSTTSHCGFRVAASLER
jgi:formylglycine-generating enzyme